MTRNEFFRGNLISRINDFHKFCGNLLSRVDEFFKFRGNLLPKTAKFSSLNSLPLVSHTWLITICRKIYVLLAKCKKGSPLSPTLDWLSLGFFVHERKRCLLNFAKHRSSRVAIDLDHSVKPLYLR